MKVKDERYKALYYFIKNSDGRKKEEILNFIIATQINNNQIKEVIEYFNIEVK